MLVRDRDGQQVEEPANTLDVFRFIMDNDSLTITMKAFLCALLRFSDKRVEKRREKGGDEAVVGMRMICFPSLSRIGRAMGRAKEGAGAPCGKRHVRRLARLAEAMGLIHVRVRTGTSSEYELDVMALHRGWELHREAVGAEKFAQHANPPQQSRPRPLYAPAWLPPIKLDEDRELVGAMIELVLATVLQRPPAAWECREHCRLVLKLWRDRGCPSAEDLVADVERVLKAAESCENWYFRHMRGEHVGPHRHAPDPSQARHDWRRRVGTVLNPRKFDARLEVAKDHHAHGGCGCRFGLDGRRVALGAYNDEERAALEKRREQIAKSWYPRFLKELAKHDVLLPGSISAEDRALLLDVAVLDRWPMGHAFIEYAWAFLVKHGRIPPRGQAQGPPDQDAE